MAKKLSALEEAKNLLGGLKNKVAQSKPVQNLTGNIRAISNPQTRGDYFRGVTSPVIRSIPGPTQGQQQIANTFTPKGFTQFSNKVTQSPIGIPGRFVMGFGKNIADTATRSGEYLKQRQELINQRTKGMSLKQRFMSQFSSPEENRLLIGGGYNAAKTLAMVNPAGVGKLKTPIQALIAGGIPAAINAGIAKYQGKDAVRAAGQGFGEGLGLRAVTRFTDPAIDKATSLLSPTAEAGKQTAKQFIASQLTKRAVGGVGNVVEDRVINKFEGIKGNNDKLSFLLGAASAGNVELVGPLVNKIRSALKGGDDSQIKAVVKETARYLRDTKGRFSKTGEKVNQASNKLFESVTGNKYDPSQFVLTEREGGLSLTQRARSRLGAQAGFIGFGGKSSDINNTGTPKIGSTELATQPISSSQSRMNQSGLGIEATDSTILPNSANQQLSQGSLKASGGTIPQISKDTQAYLSELTGKQKVASTVPGETGIKAKAGNFLKKLKVSLVDSASPIEDALSLAEKEGQFKVLPKNDVRLQIDRVLRTNNLAGQFATDNGLTDVIKKAPDLEALDQYLIAKQAAFREGQGIKTGRNLTRDQQLVNELGSTYEPLAQQVNQYSQKLLNYSVDSGLVSKDLADQLIKENPEYVPLQRIFSEIEKGNAPQVSRKGIASLSKQSVVQKIKGSEREISSPIESLLLKTQDAFNQGERNIAAKQLASYKDLPGFEGLLRELPEGETAKHTISFLDNGVKRVLETTPEIEAAAKSLNQQQMNIVTKIFSVPTRVLQVGATGLNIPFTVTNTVKDQITSFINSNKAAKTSLMNPGNFVKALFSAVKHDDLYDEVIRNAAGGTSFDISREAPGLSIKKLRAGKNVGTKIAYTVTHPGELLKAVEDVIGRSEELGRIQNYRGTKEALLKSGRTLEDAQLLGAQAARENTANFARKGEVGKVLNYVIPFFNAGIQGARQLDRSFINRPKQTAAKVALGLFTPVAAVTAWNLSDPERKKVYEDIQDYEKENNLIVVLGSEKDAKGRWKVMKIPIPPGLSNLSSLVRRPIEQAQGLDPVRFGEVASNLFSATTSLDVSSPNKVASTFTPQLAKPLVEGVTNTNLFTGQKIIPEYMLNKPAEEQVKDQTSGIARAIGKFTNQSPLMIENAVSTVAGGLGKQVLNASDRTLASAGKIPEEQVGGESVLQNINKRFASAAGGKSQEFLYDANLSEKQRTEAQRLLDKDPKKAQKFVDDILANRQFEKDVEAGKPITIKNPTPNQLKLIKKTAVEKYAAGDTTAANELRSRYKVNFTAKDTVQVTKAKKAEAIKLYLEGDLEGAKKVREQYKLKVSKADAAKEARKKAIELYRDGRKEEALELKNKFGFTVTRKDVYGI